MNKKLLITLSLISITVLSITILRTYSLYETNANAIASKRLATWEIKVNNTDITNLSTINREFNLGSLSWTNQSHVKEGKGAPGSIGTLNISIVPTNTEVSFMYELTIDLSELNNNEFQIQEIREINGESLIRTGQTSYTGIARLSDIENGKNYNIEVKFIWNNSIDNDESDYELGSRSDENINIPITFHVKQYLNDTIEEYIENSTEENEEEPGSNE